MEISRITKLIIELHSKNMNRVPSSNSVQNNSLFVGDLPKFCSEVELEELFTRFGQIIGNVIIIISTLTTIIIIGNNVVVLFVWKSYRFKFTLHNPHYA